MLFIYKYWEDFCKKLSESGIHSIPAREVNENSSIYLIFKHDVETNIRKAYDLSVIEYKYGHRGSYYVQAYLLKDKKNIELLHKISELGHEVSYHYDVMDSQKGNINKACIEFENNLKLFEQNGFNINTVCQHGNPIINRIGYTSNRDFFRNTDIQKRFAGISDIMVNYKNEYKTDYCYYSDAGRKFKFIYDPINNDIVDSENKNVTYDTLDELLVLAIDKHHNIIISIHPHRWTRSRILNFTQNALFYILRNLSRLLKRNKFFMSFFSKYYFLAKKI